MLPWVGWVEQRNKILILCLLHELWCLSLLLILPVWSLILGTYTTDRVASCEIRWIKNCMSHKRVWDARQIRDVFHVPYWFLAPLLHIVPVISKSKNLIMPRQMLLELLFVVLKFGKWSCFINQMKIVIHSVVSRIYINLFFMSNNAFICTNWTITQLKHLKSSNVSLFENNYLLCIVFDCPFWPYLVLFQVHWDLNSKFNRKQVRFIADPVDCFSRVAVINYVLYAVFCPSNIHWWNASGLKPALLQTCARWKFALIKLTLDRISLRSQFKNDTIFAYLFSQIITELPNSFISSQLCCCCSKVPNPTSNFLQCAGLPPTDAGRDHIHRLKQILEAAMDVYTFMVLE